MTSQFNTTNYLRNTRQLHDSSTATKKSININQVGFEVLTAVVMKRTIFWYITPCSPLKVN
jgi:hypothetical protein